MIETHLGGVASQASRFERAAFRTACLEDLLDAQVSPWTAIAVTYDAGNWREVVAELPELRVRVPGECLARRTSGSGASLAGGPSVRPRVR